MNCNGNSRLVASVPSRVGHTATSTSPGPRKTTATGRRLRCGASSVSSSQVGAKRPSAACSDKYNVESEYYTRLMCHSVSSGQASDFARKEAIELCS